MRKILRTSVLGLILIINAINLFAENHKPVIVNDVINVQIGDTLTLDALQNDYDPDGDTFIAILANFKYGSGIVARVGGKFEIKIHNYTYNEIDTIRYLLRDEGGEFSDMGYVVVNISPNKVRDTLDINNMSVPLASWGEDYFKRELSGYGGKSCFNIPKDSNTSTIYTSSLWLGAYDNSNNILHTAVRKFTNKPSDFMYGPIRSQKGDPDGHDSTFNRVWKLSVYQIEDHISNHNNPNYVMLDAIKNWPAHGDMSKGEAAYIAPFVDVDGDGVYNPQQGDYPKIKGDECILSIYNDNLVPKYGSDINNPLIVEIHQMVYGYNCAYDTVLDHTLFISYDIYNRSAVGYRDFYIGNFYDFDLGCSRDDYVGCDTSKNIFFTYNATNNDNRLEGGYGINPPAQGVKFLNYELSRFNVSYDSYGSNVGPSVPSSNLEYYNVMSGLLKDGSAVTNGGYGLSGNSSTKYFYPGNVNDPNQWSELSAGNNPQDNLSVGSAGPFNFLPGMKLTLDVALIYARDINKTNLENLDLLLQRSDYIQDIYDGVVSPVCEPIISSLTKVPEIGFNIYPNPTNDKLNIRTNNDFINSEYNIYSITGKSVGSGILKNNTETISVSNLKTGIYFLSITEGIRTYSQKFVVK